MQLPYHTKHRRMGTMSVASSSFNQVGGTVGQQSARKVQVRENPLNVTVKSGQRLGLSDRFPGYFRMENGALWCHN